MSMTDTSVATGRSEAGAAGGAGRRAVLSSLRAGEVGVIREVRLGGEDAALLRAMGLCVQAKVRVFRVGSPCVVAVGGVKPCKCGGMCRVGIARGLADGIVVDVAG